MAEFARLWPDLTEYERQIDRMLMYLARYGYQNAFHIESNVPSATVRSWVDRIGEFLEEERRQVENKMR